MAPTPVAAASGYQQEIAAAEQKDFMYWLKSGLAFTLPLFGLGTSSLCPCRCLQ